jgi:hypothetical protein
MSVRRRDVTIQDLGSLGELVAAIATVATLVYLAIQIRQNTQSMRAAAFQASTTRASDLTKSLAQDKDLFRIFAAGSREPNELDEADRGRYLMLLNTFARQYEDLFFQYRSGALDSESWDAWQASYQPIIQSRGYSLFWQLRANAFTAAFRHHIEVSARVSVGDRSGEPAA